MLTLAYLRGMMEPFRDKDVNRWRSSEEGWSHTCEWITTPVHCSGDLGRMLDTGRNVKGGLRDLGGLARLKRLGLRSKVME